MGNSPAVYPFKRYITSPQTDRLIHDAYIRHRTGDRSALQAAAHSLGWPKGAVLRRGAELGIARTKERPWCDQELEILSRFGHLNWTRIRGELAQAGYHRTCTAISVKMTRLRVKSNLDGYSACKLAHACGVDVHKVLTWIRRGVLKAERRGTERRPEQGGDTWWIDHKDVKRFVYRFPEEIDLARVEKFWFLDLLTDGKICR